MKKQTQTHTYFRRPAALPSDNESEEAAARSCHLIPIALYSFEQMFATCFMLVFHERVKSFAWSSLIKT